MNPVSISLTDANTITDILQRCDPPYFTNGPGWGPTTIKRLGEFADAAEAGNVSIERAGLVSCNASSFADPDDVARFVACKRTGRSDNSCFSVGDNGIGEFGANTAQDVTAMVAVHHDAMVARWGSVAASAHKKVRVNVNGASFEASVEDRISATGRIDLNPACAKLANLHPPFVVPCTWGWVDDLDGITV